MNMLYLYIGILSPVAVDLNVSLHCEKRLRFSDTEHGTLKECPFYRAEKI